MKKRHHQNIMKPYLLAFVTLALVLRAESATSVLASYDFSEGQGPTTVAEGVSASIVSVTGATLIFPTLYEGNPSPAIAARAWLGGRNNDRYYSLTISNTSAITTMVNGISMDLRNESPGTGPTGFAVMSSADNFLTDLATGTLDWQTRAWVEVDAMMNVMLEPNQTLEFRVTGWGANSIPPQGGHLLMDNISVTTIPEPSSLVIFTLGTVVLASSRRRDSSAAESIAKTTTPNKSSHSNRH